MYFVHVYIFKKKIQKKKTNSRFPNLSQKKRKIFKKKKKSLDEGNWALKSSKKKKKTILWTMGIELPSDFFKKAHFFFQRFQDSLKSHFQNGTWGFLRQNIF